MRQNNSIQTTFTNSPSGEGGMEIIPAIDIIEGKCVRLTHGNYSQKKIYNGHPLEVAKGFEDAGLTRLHLVDLDGAREGKVRAWKVLETIAGKTAMVIDFGGGIKAEKDLQIVFDSGAALATVGSMAVKEKEIFAQWLQKFGAGKFFLGADVKAEKLTISGWTEQTDIWIYDFIEDYTQKGVKRIFCTDVSKDGALGGPSTELYKSIVEKFPDLHFVASGGVSSIDDVSRLQEAGCKGVIIGKAIYEGHIRLDDLKKIRMIVENFWAFALTGLLLNLTPGNDMVYVMARSSGQGTKAGVVSALGIGAGCVVHILAAVIGLSALLAQSAMAFSVIKYTGAAYLVYLGLKAVLAKRQRLAVDKIREERSYKIIFWQGVLTNVLNPKVALFFLAFLPQFINTQKGNTAARILFLGTWFDAVGTVVNVLVALLFGKIGVWLLKSPQAIQWQERITGTLLIGLGMKVAIASKE